jgi:hypothetical protein
MAADESSAPRHGRHSAVGRHAAPRVESPAEETIAPVEKASVAEAISVPESAVPAVESAAERATGSEMDLMPIPDSTLADLVPIIDGDQETRLGDAPRPIDVDPSETGSFERIGAADGARVTTRANASQTASFRLENARPMEAVRMSSAGRPKVERHEVAVQSNRRVFLILGIAAAVVVAIVGTLLTRALLSMEKAPEKVVAEQTQAAGDEGIEYRGTTYQLTKQDKGYALTSTSEGSEGTAVLCELKGTPVTLILYNTVFVIPENLPDGTWDLIAHPLGGGGVTQQVTDGEGKPVTGKGEISEALLVGDAVRISTTTGEKIDVSLV